MVAQHTTTLQALLVDDYFDGDVYCNESMSRHTSYHVGGPAKFFVRAHSLTSLGDLIDACREEQMEWIIVGKGSNLLVSDKGFAGVVITLDRDFKKFRFDEDRSCLVAGAGVTLSTLVQEAFKHGLAGIEYLVGTPGTVGGGLRMNAGSRSEWIGSAVQSVTTYVPGSGLKRYSVSDITWSYRETSIPRDEIIIECELGVKSAPVSYIRGKMEGALSRRKKSQPLEYPSCGSVFRNPEGMHAAALIEQAGLKGYTIGGAQVSELHANFIINKDGATASDVVALIDSIITRIKEDYGIELKPEVEFLGFTKT